jgi:hypothetical protein
VRHAGGISAWKVAHSPWLMAGHKKLSTEELIAMAEPQSMPHKEAYTPLAAAIGPQAASMCFSSSDRWPEPAGPRGPLRDLPEWLLPQADPISDCPLGVASKIGAYPAAHRPSIAASRRPHYTKLFTNICVASLLYCWFLFLFSSSIVFIEHLLTVCVFFY